MDRIERKTNIFYNEYLPEVKELVETIRKKGVNVEDLERLIAGIEDSVKKKDYLAADQLITMLQDELEKAKLEAGIFDSTGLF